jgi:hypothetical protein
MRVRYENRLVAFVDILGISELLLADRDGAYANAISAVISALTRKTDVVHILRHVKTGREVEVEFDTPCVGARITTISDAIVMSYPVIEPANELHLETRIIPIFTCLESVFWLQRALLSVGIRSRGGIACGRLLHKRDLVMGEGLIKAYRLESKLANYPRTVIDSELINVLLSDPIPEKIVLLRERIAHLIRVDSDGEYFVDYLGFSPLDVVQTLRWEMDNILKETQSDLETTTNERIRQKLQWLYDYARMAWGCMVVPAFHLTANEGTAFGTQFVRAQTSVREWIDKNEKLILRR